MVVGFLSVFLLFLLLTLAVGVDGVCNAAVAVGGVIDSVGVIVAVAGGGGVVAGGCW